MTVPEVVAQLQKGKRWPMGAEELSPQVWIVPWKRVHYPAHMQWLIRAKNAWYRLVGSPDKQANPVYKIVRDTDYAPYRICQALYKQVGVLFEFYPKDEICDKHQYAQFQIYMGDVMVAYPEEVLTLGHAMVLQIPINP